MSCTRLIDYIVIRDSREKLNYGWDFQQSHPNKKPPKCLGTEISTLKTGDYTIKDYEDILTIERKDSFVELWNNYSYRARFESEVLRMSQYKYAYILIESCLTPETLGL